jgi:hypothetical protein
MFTALVGIVALIVAGCAAFFSVQGLATLYAARYIAVCVMTGSLEIGKLVAASFLHRYWKTCGWMLKTYLTLAVVVLMAITSLGIFGFLTGAYQQSHVKVEITDVKQEAFTSKKVFLQEEINSLNDRVKTLNDARKAQEKRLPELSSRAAKPIYDDIKRSGDEINATRAKIDDLSNQLLQASQDSINIKVESSKETDIGTLKYVAKAFNVPMDDVVKWFTLAIVCVFDPLAVALVLAYNSLIENKEPLVLLEEEEEQIVEEPKAPSKLKKALKHLINYRA